MPSSEKADASSYKVVQLFLNIYKKFFKKGKIQIN